MAGTKSLNKHVNQFHIELGEHLHKTANINLVLPCADGEDGFDDADRRGFIASINSSGKWIVGLGTIYSSPWLVREGNTIAGSTSVDGATQGLMGPSRRAAISLSQPMVCLVNEFDTANTYLPNQFLTADANGKFTNKDEADADVLPPWADDSSGVPVVGFVLEAPPTTITPTSHKLLRIHTAWFPGKTVTP